MLRILISLVLVTTLRSPSASAQLPLPLLSDTTVNQAGDTVSAAGDSSIMRSRDVSSRRPKPAEPIAIPKQRSGICGSVTRVKCALYGALIAGSVGYFVGQAASAQPKYEKLGLLDGGSIFGGDVCTAHCGIPHKAIVFGLSGSAVGSLAGWLIGRE